MTIGERICNLRIQEGLSQEELAEKVGYKSRSAVQKIEGNLRDVSHSMIISFAKALNTTPHYLLGWLDSPDARVPGKSPPELKNDERHLLDLFRQLSPKEQGNLIGRAELLVEQHREAEKQDAG